MGCGWLGRRSLWGDTPLGKARLHGCPWCSLGMRHTPALSATDGEDKCCRMWSRYSFPLKDTVCGLSQSQTHCAPPPSTLSPLPVTLPSILPRPAPCLHTWRLPCVDIGPQARDQALPIVGRGRAECPHCVAPAWSPTVVSLGCGAPVTSPHFPGGVGRTWVSVTVGESRDALPVR